MSNMLNLGLTTFGVKSFMIILSFITISRDPKEVITLGSTTIVVKV